MENFYSLRAEKQEHIINAALTVFGKNGYKKASIADIAGLAGIAKGMVMYYFGSKKNLYLYLVELSGKVMTEELEKGLDPEVTDFFDKIRMMSDIKMLIMKRYPALMTFLANVYYETDAEVADEVKSFMAEGLKTREKMVLIATDTSRLKEDINPQLLDKFLVWTGEGMGTTILKDSTMETIDEHMQDFYKVLELMKKYFYN
ncbi:MAG: TetR/AcrR family transcriptional regulator [Lachnospiraceae bacterium]|jgi:AcrR family transcriptional regulator|nr:TetR/AcrR family transcriptional regulator [Lachnospiraceae bacterium]